MKFYHYIICLLLLASITTAWGQKSYTLSQKDDNVSKSYIARDFIQLLPGYSFSSAGGKTLYLGINEHILESAEYQHISQLPNPNRNIDTSYAVGTIAGTASVTPTGAAIYQIPIEVMPGTGGMQPNVSIVYNSQSGNGLVGYGWSLGAVSAITRIGKTIYHDGKAEAPNLTTSDNLMFDGQRLMRASGNNLAASSTYKTEVESFLDITCKTLNSYLGFEIKNKEGWVMEYGSSADSYIKPKDDSTTAYAWLLKKVTDANGNYMTYTYENDAVTGEFRLKQIDYTGNTAANLSPYNKIEFLYENRTDSTTSYIAGKSIKQSLILKRIKCSAYGSTVREYKFNYCYSDGFYSRLTEVEEYGQDGLQYNSTIIDWGDIEVNYSHKESEYESSLSVSNSDKNVEYADFNGDGKTDILCYPTKNSYSSSDYVTLYLADSNSVGETHFTKQCTIPLIENFENLLIADLNGDGKLDIIRVSKASNNNYKYDYYLFNSTAFVNSSKGFTANGKTGIAGDFNGDGKMEILVKETQEIFNENGGKTTTTGTIDWGTKYWPCYPNNRFLSDFNGNGKTNLLITNGTSCWVYELSGTTFVKLTSFSSTDLKNSQFPYFADFNGDGKTDILVQNPGGTVYILFSTGTGFQKKTVQNTSMVPPQGGEIPGIRVGDFNKDGKSDIFYMFESGNSILLYLGFWTGSDFQTHIHGSNLFKVSDVINLNYPPFSIADFDGDGRTDFCVRKSQTKFVMHTFYDRQHLLVKNIVNGLNQKTSFSYNSIAEAGIYTESSQSVTFPVINTRFPLYVVNSMTQQLGDFSNTESFHYKGAKIHKQGKGFLGFEEVKTTNSQQNRETTTRYGYNTTYFNVYPTKQMVTTAPTTSSVVDSISRTDFVNDYNIFYLSPVSRYIMFPYVSKQTTVDKLTGITKKIEYGTYNHDKPNKVTETQGSLITETEYTWEAKGGSSFENRLTEQKITRKGIGATFTETKKFEYDSKARLTKKIDYSGHAKAVTTSYSNYDNFGNPQTITTSAANCPTITTSSVYDATGRFVVRHTDELGNISFAQYEPKTGVLLEKNDIAGLKTTYQYDGFQRLVKEITPVDQITYSTNWDISGNNLFKTAVQSPITGTYTAWYNSAGQEIKTQKPKKPGNPAAIVSEKEYNTLGQLYRSYLPGYTDRSSQYVEYEYDVYGRIKKEINLGRTTEYAYNNLTTTVTAPDNTTGSTTLNLSGLVASSTDAAGNSVTYTYNSLGKPETVSSNGITTTIKYDNRGFQRALRDANLKDSIKYEYNAYGQLTSQTNARKLSRSYQYDAAGRIKQESNADRILTYEYVSSGNGIGQIQTIKQNYATALRSYTYTSLGQVSSVTEKIDNVDYTTNYIYNASGQMIEQQSPSGMKVVYQYTDGLLTSMRNGENNSLLWQVNNVNALGQTIGSSFGNGLNRFFGYDSYNLPSQIQLKDASVIDQVSYNFNAITGNLTSRNDISNSKNEAFGYDNLNRLTSIKLNSSTANSISYHANGNINTKFDVGTYQYANSNHAVSGITNKVSSYSPSTLGISYNVHNRVSQLTQQGSTVKRMNFEYDADNQRKKTLYYENNILKKTMYYVGNYEKEVITGGTTKEYDYIYTPDGLSAIAVKTNGTRSFYFVHTDHLGSIRLVTKQDKSIQTRYHYDAWGKQTLVSGTSITNRGYTGHEHLNDFGLINMNARLYDPVLGRFMGVDPYVQEPDFTQSHNRYAYCLNNPLIYTDPDGEWFFTALLTAVFPGVGTAIGTVLDGMCWGATIGAGTGAIAYTVGAGISGNWSWSGFGNAIGMGAVGGAIGGGFGALGSIGALGSFGNSLGYGILNQAASNALTNTMFGNDLTWGSVAGSLVGGLAGAGLPNFTGIEGGAFKNAIAEIGFNSAKGAFSGFYSGVTQAAIDKNPDALWQNTLGGAISGASTSLMNIALLGPAYKPHDTYYSHDREEQSTYRKGGLLLRDGAGINLGRSLGTSGEGDVRIRTEVHESTHLWQQRKMGWANFYGKTITSYVSEFFKYGTIDYLYNTHGTLEWQADKARYYYMRNIR